MMLCTADPTIFVTEDSKPDMTKAAGDVISLFPTLLYRSEVDGVRLNRALAHAALNLAASDDSGAAWCERHGYAGYTSYGSIDDLAEQDVAFARLEAIIERHAKRFARELCWDLRGGSPAVDSMWVNVLPEGGSHTSHLHTNAVLSGTYYVKAPAGASPIVFEDPRHAMMMAAPPRKANAPRNMRTYVSEMPSAGALLIWESWLRHEVPMNRSEGERISISFNCVIAGG